MSSLCVYCCKLVEVKCNVNTKNTAVFNCYHNGLATDLRQVIEVVIDN